MFSRRGQSEEPELMSHRAPIQLQVDRDDDDDQKRARSVGPQTRKKNKHRHPPKYGEQYTSDASLQGPNRAMINQHVNPYQEFPSLRRGFTLRDQIPPAELVSSRPDPTKDGNVFAYYFWVAILFLFVVSLITFAFNIAIIVTFKLTPSFGFMNMEIFPDSNLIKFSDGASFDKLVLNGGILAGYQDQPLVFRSNEGDIVFKGGFEEGNEAMFKVSEVDGVSIENVDSFKLIDPDTNEVIFDSNNPRLTVEAPIDRLIADEVMVNEITTPIGEDMLIKSDGKLSLVAAEGITVDGKEVAFEAGDELTLSGENVRFDTPHFAIDPRALPLGGGGYPGEEAQYKVCICMPDGLLFRVPVPKLSEGALGPLKEVSCDEAEGWEYHPCTGEERK